MPCLSIDSNKSQETKRNKFDDTGGTDCADSMPIHNSGCRQLSHIKNCCSAPLSAAVYTPLPCLSWADPQDVWRSMMKKEASLFFCRDQIFLTRHPCLQERMRAILIDWIIEVCEVYKLHRATFYLAVDFIDRYLSAHRGVQKTQLQLIGVTALFVASKLEEIYPPKLADFVYVTDGACLENDIVDQELLMLKVLQWDLNPVTINSWLTTYLQMLSMRDTIWHGRMEDKCESTVQTASVFSAYSFIQISRLLDLCILDMTCLQFNYSILAAAALYHVSNEQMALSASGYTWNDIVAAVSWMAPFAITLREAGSTNMKCFENVPPEDAHNIQTHAVDLHLLDMVQMRQTAVLQASRLSPDLHVQQQKLENSLLTPPPSNHKLHNHPLDHGLPV